MDSALDHHTIIRHQVVETTFGLYTGEDVKRLSVRKITNHQCFDQLNNPIVGGLYDPALGPIDFSMICPTCHLTQKECPGHMGHIELPVPVYNPVLFTTMFGILKRICFGCKKFRMGSLKKKSYLVKLRLLDARLVDEASTLFTLLDQRDGDWESSNLELDQKKHLLLDDYDKLALSTIKKLDSSSPAQRHLQVLRAETVHKFLSSQPASKCENCDYISPSLRQDMHTKIFQKALGARSLKANRSKHMDMKSALDTVHQNNRSLSSTNRVSEPNPHHPGSNSDDSNDDDNDDDDDDDDKNDSDDDNRTNKADRHGLSSKSKSTYLPPLEVKTLFEMLWKTECDLAELIWGGREGKKGYGGWQRFFLEAIPVTPSRFRPPAMMGDMQFEHSQNVYLSKILTLCQSLLNTDEKLLVEDPVNPVKVDLGKKIYLWMELQNQVNCLIDSSNARRPQDVPQGIRQVIEKKEGLFRKHMMGKRVNYSARSVISPDPYISTSEIGVPLRFAKKLTYPQPVTPWNVVEMRQLVINGSEIHPGANFVEDEAGRLIDLSKRTVHQREAISKTLLTRSASSSGTSINKVKRVWRHLRSGDVVLMNRQPTLHKPSMMAHVTRVLTNPKMQTIRMHYANCNTFNADFDGDEMNMHFPQNELARSEAYHIACNDNQYIVPTDGSPLRGLIQDHVGAGVKLSMKDTFLTRDQYVQLMFNAWSCLEGIPKELEHLEILPPTLFKPVPLWTGKQVITTLLKQLTKGLPQLNLNAKGKIKADAFGVSNAEHLVIVHDGELVQGVLDKNQFGAAEYGLVHGVYELYGSSMAAKLLTSLGRLFTAYVQLSGHTCALEDLTLTQEAEEARCALVKESECLGQQAYAEFAGMASGNGTGNSNSILSSEERLQVREMMRKKMVGEAKELTSQLLDAHMMKCVHSSNSEIIKTCLPNGQTKLFPKNCFSLMVMTGAKGSMVNHSQISCGLGQQALEGRRVPTMVSGKSLPSFEPYDPSPRAGGFITDRFLTGLRPAEYYFHCMAGREGLVDTAVKTSRSGYLQRCLVKHLEDLQVAYDHTVRNSEGNVIQFLYGEDGIDPLESGFLSGQDDQMSFLAMNHSALSHKFSIHGNFFENTGLEMMQALQLHRARMEYSKNQAITNATSTTTRTTTTMDLNKSLQCYPSSHVRARKLKEGCMKWKKGTIEKGWFDAEILHAVEDSSTGEFKYDLKYLDTGCIEKSVPFCIQVKGSKTSNAKTSSGTLQLVQTIAPDPVLHALPLNQHLGVVSEKIQQQLVDYNQRNPHYCLDLHSQSGHSHKKHKKKKKKKQIASENHQEEEEDANSNNSSPSSYWTNVVSPGAFELLLWVKYMRSLCQPGENVGTVAAQSVGEPSTQMTLNTFHLAGHGAANVTLGIPRLREIIMTASSKMKTPSMTIPLLNSSKELGNQVAQKLNQVPLKGLIACQQGIHVTEQLQLSHPGSVLWIREYRIRIQFHKMKAIKKAFGISRKEIFSSISYSFMNKLLLEIRNDMKKSGLRLACDTLGKQECEDELEDENQEPTTGRRHSKDDDDEEEDEEEQGTLTFGRKKELQGYGEMDEDDEQIRKEQDARKTFKHAFKTQDANEEELEEEDENDHHGKGVNKNEMKKNKMVSTTMEEEGLELLTVSNSTSKNQHFAGCFANKKKNYVMIHLRFPAHFKKLLVVRLVETCAERVLVRHCPGISRCVSLRHRMDGVEEECIQTEGLNFSKIWEMDDVLDVNRLVTNDIYQILHTYGVEAARASISKQINEVFGVYGIQVDPRHLSLLADYMTYGGDYMPLNRSGMDRNSSPFQQMSFETSMKFLTEAATFGLQDAMQSPSARLVLGLPTAVGTGSFDLLQPLQLA